MPNRILKESICTSDSVNELTPFEETVFYRLIVNCDDYGRFDGRIPVLRSRLFPLKSVTDKQVDDAVKKLGTLGMVLRYEVDGKAYIMLTSWDSHQQIRAKKSKYPAPLHDMLLAGVINCNQMISGDSKCTRNPIQSESESESEETFCAEPENPASTPEPRVMSLSLNDGTEYQVSANQVEEWAELYPAVDIMQALRNMKGWLQADSRRRKTRRGILRFINGWLAKDQDRGGSRASPMVSADDLTRQRELEAWLKEDESEQS